MKILKRIGIFAAAVVIFISVMSVPVSAKSSYETYIYSYDGDTQISPNAYTTEYEISDFGLKKGLDKPSDMVRDNSGKRLFIADTGNNRIVVVGTDMKAICTIDSYPSKDGKSQTKFSEPQGVFYSKDELLYVCDTKNANIVIFDTNYKYVRTIYAPSAKTFPDGFKYNPKSVAVDNTGRMYIISLNTNMGVLTMDKNGDFQGFIGAQRVSANFAELVARMFMSDEQIERSARFVPMEYSNLTIDSKGFIYVTSAQIERYNLFSAVWSRSGDSTFAPIKKINPAGTDVLRRNGFFPPVGDVNFDAYEINDKDKQIDPSQLSEVTLLDNGMYSLIDSDGNKVFTYDSYGNLLYAFGGKGESLGLYSQLSAVQYIDDMMYSLDTLDGSITVFRKTDYGKKIDTVIGYQENRQFDKARELWQEILNQNNNFDMAYLGIGKTYLENGKYTEAMEYFKLINNKEYYSKAFKLQRQQNLENTGLYLVLAIVAVIVGLVFVFGKINKFNQKRLDEKTRGKLWDEIMFAFYTIFHPFKGFYIMKAEKRGSVRAANVILAVACGVYIFKDFGCGYLLKADSGTSILSSVANILLPVALWCIANWCLTSLMDGKGKAKDIYISTCYSLLPLIILYFATTIIGRFLISEELTFLSFAINIGMAWTLCLVFMSMTTIHEYSFGRNVVTSVLSLIVVGIILFLLMIFFSLSGQMISLINNAISEVTFRS